MARTSHELIEHLKRAALAATLASVSLSAQAQLTEAAHAEVRACFTPPAGCAQAIISLIETAQTSIRVQAYWFTSVPILQSLSNAQQRGVDVQVLLDKTNDRNTYSAATYLQNAGIPIWVDDTPTIAHSKVIIIDGVTTIGGSFNFTKSADTRNAENVTVIDAPEVAKWFLLNWENRQAVSRRYQRDSKPHDN